MPECDHEVVPLSDDPTMGRCTKCGDDTFPLIDPDAPAVPHLRFRVDVFCSGGWQWVGSFAGDADAYQYGELYATSGARVWDGDECIAVTYGPRSWRAPRHNRDCNGRPCECGAVPPIGSMATGALRGEATKP